MWEAKFDTNKKLILSSDKIIYDAVWRVYHKCYS